MFSGKYLSIEVIKRRILSLFICIVFLFSTASPVFAYDQDFINAYHWPTYTTSYYYTGGLPSAYAIAVKSGANSWNAALSASSGPYSFRFINTTGSSSSTGYAGVLCFYGNYGNSSWVGQFALKDFTVSNNAFTAGHCTLSFNSYYESSEMSTQTRKESVACHELGHMFRLDDWNYANDRLMGYYRNRNSIYVPQTKDIRALGTRYKKMP